MCKLFVDFFVIEVNFGRRSDKGQGIIFLIIIFVICRLLADSMPVHRPLYPVCILGFQEEGGTWGQAYMGMNTDMKKTLNRLLHHFKTRLLVRRTGTAVRPVRYKGWDNIENVLVVWTASALESGEWQKRLAQSLKNVRLDKLCFVPEGTESLEAEDTVILRNEDLGFSGKIRNKRLLALLDRPYDLLVDLTEGTNALVRYVLVNARAACVIGAKKEGGAADIVIDGPVRPADFVNQMIEVLSGINAYGNE